MNKLEERKLEIWRNYIDIKIANIDERLSNLELQLNIIRILLEDRNKRQC